MRDYLINSQSKIMFEELPNVDYLWKLARNILVVRSECLLELERDLYDELIMIHRDPSLMIEKTRDRQVEIIEAQKMRDRFRRSTRI